MSPTWPPDDPDILEALRAAFADGSWGRYHGGHVERLESRLAEYHGVAHAVTCASGTLAVEVALRAVGVGPGDEVIVGAYDYESNFLSVHAIGATPVLVDVHAGNACLDPTTIPAAVGPKTKAVIASHLHGGLVPMRELMDIAAAHGLTVVEDAAQACGAVVQGRRAGAWGDVGVLSFGGSKLLSAGRGGAILTGRTDVHQRAKLWLQRGVQAWAALSELQAVALLPQLGRLDERNARRASAVRQLVTAILHSPGLTPLVNAAEGSPAYYKLGFWYDAAAVGRSREEFTAATRAAGVALDAGFRAAHVGRAPSRYRRSGVLVNATRAHDSLVVLHHAILLGTAEDLAGVAATVEKLCRRTSSFV
jgi:dTDP-4-amino-4,6-dideoxygalactose transaminase